MQHSTALVLLLARPNSQVATSRFVQAWSRWQSLQPSLTVCQAPLDIPRGGPGGSTQHRPAVPASKWSHRACGRHAGVRHDQQSREQGSRGHVDCCSSGAG